MQGTINQLNDIVRKLVRQRSVGEFARQPSVEAAEMQSSKRHKAAAIPSEVTQPDLPSVWNREGSLVMKSESLEILRSMVEEQRDEEQREAAGTTAESAGAVVAMSAVPTLPSASVSASATPTEGA